MPGALLVQALVREWAMRWAGRLAANSPIALASSIAKEIRRGLSSGGRTFASGEPVPETGSLAL